MADPFPPAPQWFGTLSAYTPSLRERLIAAMQNAVGGTANQRGTASDFAENAGNVLGMVPGVSNVLGADDAVRQYQGGHSIQAALTGAMALPIPGASAAEDAVEGPAQKLVKAITAKLTPAVMVDGKVYQGTGTHLNALQNVPMPERKSAILNAGNRGYVDPEGNFLDRWDAQKYAQDNNLFKHGAPEWAATAPELTAENLKQFPQAPP